jgi:hypothetical protein
LTLYGAPPPEKLKKQIENQCKMKCPYTTKDIQSLMNNACGFYCLAMAHFITASKYRTGELYRDVDEFLDLFDDLNHSVDFKKNEYILMHFFRSPDVNNRKPINNIHETHDFYEKILKEDSGGIDLIKMSGDVKNI